MGEKNQNDVMHKINQVSTVDLFGIPIVSLCIDGQERLCLAQISNTLLKQFSYNEIHNRRVALGITCVQCTPVQLEILRRAGAMPVSSRRCGMITRREAERLCKSFLGDNAPPRLPDDFAFIVHHKCAWGCRGSFLPSRYNSSRAKCIKCSYCGIFFSPNKFIFHSHRLSGVASYVQPDAANFNSWRRHLMLCGEPPEHVTHAWEDVKAMFNGGTRKRLMHTNGPSATNCIIAKTNINNENLTQNSTECSSQQSTSHVFTDKKNCFESIFPQEPTLDSLKSTTLVGLTTVATVGTVQPINNNHKVFLPFRHQSIEQNTSRPLSHSIVMDYMWQKHLQSRVPGNFNDKHNTIHSFPFYLLKPPESAYLDSRTLKSNWQDITKVSSAFQPFRKDGDDWISSIKNKGEYTNAVPKETMDKTTETISSNLDAIAAANSSRSCAPILYEELSLTSSHITKLRVDKNSCDENEDEMVDIESTEDDLRTNIGFFSTDASFFSSNDVEYAVSNDNASDFLLGKFANSLKSEVSEKKILPA